MKSRVIKKVLSLLVVFTLILQQTGFAQGIGQLDISKYIGAFSGPQQFRPLLLRFFSYDPLTDNFRILLDKGDLKDIKDIQVKEEGQILLKYFLVGIALSDENFWVNLRPDSESQIIGSDLARTDVGKVLLEADLELKKDLARFTSPENPTGREYWNKLYAKAGQIFNSENITIPTLTRPWIVPGEVIIRETAQSAYVYKATLKVMLEQDHLKNSTDYNFKDPRLKELNEYSSQLIREKIIPKLTKEVNSSTKYASLRQVFNSLILARWFKSRFAGKSGTYPKLINTGNLNGLASKASWSKTTYFKEYQKSFSSGEYNIKEQVNTVMGPTIRTYFSGGIAFQGELKMPTKGASSPLGTFLGNNPIVTRALLGNGMVAFAGTPASTQVVPNLESTVASPAGGVSPRIGVASSPLQIRTELTVPEGQPKGFFTNDHHGYRIAELFAKPIEQIPDAVVDAVRNKLDRDIAQGKIFSAEVRDFIGTDIDIHVTHNFGENNAAVQRVILDAIREGCLKAQELGLLKKDIDVKSMSLVVLSKVLRVKSQPHSITERGSEAVVIVKILGASIGAAGVKLFHEFAVPGSTPLKKLGFLPRVNTKKGDKLIVRGFRFVVRRTADILKGNYGEDADVWEYEVASAATIDGKYYRSVDQSNELMAQVSQPNDYQITAIYPSEGSLLPSTEPVVSVEYQPVYGEEGDLRTLNPTFICRSQSGADAVGGIASMFYDVNFVPGGPNGERYVVTKPATLEEARRAPEEGFAHVVVYGWQSEGGGYMPRESDTRLDHVGMNPPVFGPENKLSRFLASIMTTHKHDQPYLSSFVAQAQVEPIRKAQRHLFNRAPKDADIDPVMDEVEAKVASGESVAVDDDKGDMGGNFGHNLTPLYMLAIDLATGMEAIEKGLLTDANIIGKINQLRLEGRVTSVGDDGHCLTLGDKTRGGAASHQLSFLSFTRGYLASVVGNRVKQDFPKGLYGRGQDFAGKEAKKAMKNPYFYSQFSERFFEILREVMPLEYMTMVDKMYSGWKKWQETKREATVLLEPFSGNVSQQGIGSARYLIDKATGERTFGILAGDKMGPAALNRVIREGVYAALAAGEFKNGLVYEVWDAKAFDEHGNIPIDELPGYADIEEFLPALKKEADQDYVKSCYNDDGTLKDKLSVAKKTRLARLIKNSGYVPSKRIFLDAQQDKEAIYLYLADSDRFNIKQVWSKKTSGWDINNFQGYLDRPILGSSVTKLGILAGGEYIGKDDPVMIGNMKLMKHVFEFLRLNPLIIQGDMNGSHWLGAIPTAFKYALANKESHPILVGMVYTVSEDGTKFESFEDVFDNSQYDPIRDTMFTFNFEFKKACIGGQFEPYGTNWRTVEAAYPLARFLRALEARNSPFLVRNKMRNWSAERKALRPIGTVAPRRELFEVAATLPAAASPVVSSSSPIVETEGVFTAAEKITEVRQYLNAFLNRPTDAPFTQEEIKALSTRFEALSVDEKYNFNRELLQLLYSETSLEVPEEQESRELPAFVGINGPICLDIGLVFEADPTTGALILKKVTTNPGMTGPIVAQILARFDVSHREYVVGFGSDLEGDVFNWILRKKGVGNVGLLSGPSRSNIYIYVKGVEQLDIPSKGLPLKTPRQALDSFTGARLIAYLNEHLPQPLNNRAVAVIGGQVFHGAPAPIIKGLLRTCKLKGYQVVADFRNELDSSLMKLVLEESPDIVKPDLVEFANILDRPVSELLTEDKQPKFAEIANLALTLAQKYNIKIFIVSLGEHGVIAVYRDARANYIPIFVPAPQVQVSNTTAAGDTLIAGLLWELTQGADIPQAVSYGVAAAAVTIQKDGTLFVDNPSEVDEMFIAMGEHKVVTNPLLSEPQSTIGSSPLQNSRLGGIDFRAIPMITQPMGNLSGLSFSLPKLSNLENINLDEELAQIQRMLRAGITPSGDRLKEYVAACYQKGELKQHLEGIVASLVDICKLEEEKVDVTSNAVKEVMLILDSIG